MTTLTPVELVQRIADVLLNAEGEYLAQVHNQVCSEQVAYLGDSVFESVAPNRKEFLEEFGYSFDQGTDGYWSWGAISDSSEDTFASEEDAVAHAWEDAAQQVRAILGLTLEHWAALDEAQRATLMSNALLPEAGRTVSASSSFLAGAPAQECSSKASSVPLAYTGYGVHNALLNELEELKQSAQLRANDLSRDEALRAAANATAQAYAYCQHRLMALEGLRAG